MLDAHREIQALVDNFIADLRELARRLAIEQVTLAFDVGANLSAGIGARPPSGAKRVAASRVAGATARRVAGAPAKPPAVRVRTSRPRRSEPGIEGALRDKLLAAIAEQPGRRTEELNAALGTSTKQIAQLLRRLVTDNLVRTEGARRDTRYFAIAGDAQNGRRPAPPVTAPPAATATAAATPTAASVAAVVAESAAAAEAAAVAGDQPPSLA